MQQIEVEDVVVLSPHRDDAAFSCGLLLSRLMEARTYVRIANICTFSDYAPYARLADTADPVADITALRAEEDAGFVQSLEAAFPPGEKYVHLLDLGWKDAPLRHAIATEDVLAGRPVLADEVVRLAAALRSIAPASLVLVPLALGGHIDHRLVREAAMDAWPACKLVFYEDLPYACRMAAAERKEFVRGILPWPCERAPMRPAQPGDKRRFALCYGSQIATVVADEMEDYGAELGWTECLYGDTVALGTLAASLNGNETGTNERQGA